MNFLFLFEIIVFEDVFVKCVTCGYIVKLIYSSDIVGFLDFVKLLTYYTIIKTNVALFLSVTCAKCFERYFWYSQTLFKYVISNCVLFSVL